jgi:hypothetical protein
MDLSSNITYKEEPYWLPDLFLHNYSTPTPPAPPPHPQKIRARDILIFLFFLHSRNLLLSNISSCFVLNESSSRNWLKIVFSSFQVATIITCDGYFVVGFSTSDFDCSHSSLSSSTWVYSLQIWYNFRLFQILKTFKIHSKKARK